MYFWLISLFRFVGHVRVQSSSPLLFTKLRHIVIDNFLEKNLFLFKDRSITFNYFLKIEIDICEYLSFKLTLCELFKNLFLEVIISVH